MSQTKKIGAYKVFPDMQLIMEYYSGQISLEDLIHLKKTIAKESDYDFYYTTVIDFRNADLTFKPEEHIDSILIELRDRPNNVYAVQA